VSSTLTRANEEKNMQTMNFNDLINRLKVDTSALLNFVNVSKLEFNWEKSPWLAGGALRRIINGEKLDSDFDVFFKNGITLNDVLNKLPNEFKVKKETDTALWIEGEGYTINFIKLFNDSAEKVIDNFDYTICQVISDLKTICFGDFTLWDIGRRRLVVHKITYPVASLRRMIKYTKQGYYACPGSMQEFLTAVARQPELINTQFNYID
jgi:hypothetical protein